MEMCRVFFWILIISLSFFHFPCLSLSFHCGTCKTCSALNAKIRGTYLLFFHAETKWHTLWHTTMLQEKNTYCFVSYSLLLCRLLLLRYVWIRCDIDHYYPDGSEELSFYPGGLIPIIFITGFQVSILWNEIKESVLPSNSTSKSFTDILVLRTHITEQIDDYF